MSHVLRRYSGSIVPAFAACLSVAFFFACSKSEEPPKPPAQAAPAAPQAQVGFRVTRVDLGNAIGADNKVVAPSVSFKPNDTIYASILSEGAAPNVALAVRWAYEDGQVVNESSQSIAPTGPAATEFHIAKADGFPAGKYTVVVSTNGQPASTSEFSVVE